MPVTVVASPNLSPKSVLICPQSQSKSQVLTSSHPHCRLHMCQQTHGCAMHIQRPRCSASVRHGAGLIGPTVINMHMGCSPNVWPGRKCDSLEAACAGPGNLSARQAGACMLSMQSRRRGCACTAGCSSGGGRQGALEV